jgi:hypothetical protein
LVVVELLFIVFVVLGFCGGVDFVLWLCCVLFLAFHAYVCVRRNASWLARFSPPWCALMCFSMQSMRQNMKFAGEQALKYVTLVLGLTKVDLAASLKAKFDDLLAAPPDEDKTHKKDKKDKKDKTHKKDKKDKKDKHKGAGPSVEYEKESKKQKTK